MPTSSTTASATPPRPARTRTRTARVVRWTWRVVLVLALLVALLVALALWTVHRSVPTLDGRLALPGLAAPVTVTRDALGTAVVAAGNRLDAARALGFVHAQERFFEMDLTRRSAAGELSAVFGPLALPRDQERRVHRLRARLTARFAAMAPDERAALQAYADGVNAGLAQLPVRPWQYVLLRARPAAWQPVDSLLVVAEMYWMLQANGMQAGFERALQREKAGDAVFDWLNPRGGHWDAALDGSVVPEVPMPGPEVIDLRKGPAPRAVAHAVTIEPPVLGSNDWVVAGTRTADGAALVADDMHLNISTPGIWYRAQLQIGQGPGAIRAEGVTLPGLPAIVVGANGHVAWGFTNAYGQWFDWIKVPQGIADERVHTVDETITVAGRPDVHLPVVEIDGWPVVTRRDGQAYAVRWVGDQGDAYNLALDRLITTTTVDEAVAVARTAGMPHQNFVVGDAAGHVAWTVAGRLWSAGDRDARYGRFEPLDAPAPGWLAPADYPGVKDPADGQLWTANARQLAASAGGAAIGNGGFDLGARAQQIRDRLRSRPRHDEASMQALQLDDEARFMAPWAARVAAVTTPLQGYDEVNAVLRGWNGRADANQAAYRLVREVRVRTMDALWLAWTVPLLGDGQREEKTRLDWHAFFEYPVAQALDRRPAHLLPQPYATWDEFLRAQVDAAVKDLTHDHARPLAQATWGEQNAARFRHVLGRAVPAFGRWLDLPTFPQSGDANMPRVSGPNFGQSERMVVSPGHEDRATLVVAGGQSGHPMSPYYAAGHDVWAAGGTSPLLAGPAQHTLTLAP